MKIYLATFYSSDLKRSANRFKHQAEEMKVYDKILIYNQDDLNKDFKDYINMLLKKGKERGYGHWVWQTYIHQLVLSQIDYGDIYHWCDVGCHFNQKGIWRLKEYIDLVNNDEKGFLFFSYTKPIVNKINKDYDFPNNYEYQYTKSDLLNGIIHPSPFSEQDGSTRATKSLIIIILNGIFLINYLFKQNNNLNKNFKIFLLIYYFLSIIFYKIGITRSDGGHIKQGVSLNTILLLYFVLIYFFNFLESRKKSIKYNHKIIKIVNIFLIFLFIFNNIPKNFLYNVFNIKDRYIEYIKTPDLNFLSLKEKKLIKKLRSLTVDENCIQIFTYETAISYYLQKPSCTKFYHIMNMGSKSNQFEFIKEIKDSSSKLIIVGGTYEKIGNIKGRDKIELSPKDRFPYIEEYLIKHYKELEIFEDWKILIKIN